jgi:hypothetical protein
MLWVGELLSTLLLKVANLLVYSMWFWRRKERGRKMDEKDETRLNNDEKMRVNKLLLQIFD